ncbi:MAG: methylenetetrahydrofolate--tRNA-(uracil(54)-C(5))-methyltransferase (FADH(2)-oxidizing) TrmFO, partial [Candidatus Cloacimonetes bacterium]|nr:methylenetetrahydrofolate--tRNA-(uracil(54)-C(5))-methyltransferase (FADH(2)-oxidizing) TrmFO [Candidatus Cloacimonadota bacterium]
MPSEISIIGAGLAGSEAALILADKGWQVRLYEMRPKVQTPAHQSGDLAELVCSNSFKSLRVDTASGLLKEELKLLNCRLLDIAYQCSVPAGHALAVDRALFAQKVSSAIQNHPNIQLIRKEIKELPAGKLIIASGPLTSDALMHSLAQLLGDAQLFFFDAIAPIIDADSLDYSKVYAKARYDKGEADYLNCAFEKDEYYAFVDALLAGEKYEVHEFENEFFNSDSFEFYENCMPIEELARRGKDTLRHGVMRPMGLEIPATGQKAFAVLQLRAENQSRSAYNIVGGQSMLRYPEQKRIFRMIPGLEQAEFLRYGSIHRNAYLNSPRLLTPDLQLIAHPAAYLAGQINGVESYVASIA